MMRWLVFLFFLFPALSHAADPIPATVSNIPAKYIWTNNAAAPVTQQYSAATDAAGVPAMFQTHCDAVAASVGMPRDSTPSTYVSGSGAYCYLANGPWRLDVYLYHVATCPNGGTLSMSYPNAVCQGAKTCPDGYTLNGTMCYPSTCPAGQTWNAISLKCRCDSGSDVGSDGQCCPQPSDAPPPMQYCYVANTTDTSCLADSGNGCTIRCGDVTYQKPPGGDSLVIGPFLALGQNCKYTGSYSPVGNGGGPLSDDELRDINDRVKNPGDPATPGSCLGSGMGYVTGSGGTTCVGSGGAGDVVKNTTSEKTTTNGNGTSSTTTTNKQTSQNADGTTATKTTTTTQNSDGTSTTTTTTTSKNADGTITESKTTQTKDASGNVIDSTNQQETTSDKAGWCANNPTDPACQNEKDDCPEGSDKAACARLGSAPNDGGELPTAERGISSINVVTVGSQAQCPQGPMLPFNLGRMPFDGICDLATGIRPVLLALAWLSAGLIVLGAFKGD